MCGILAASGKFRTAEIISLGVSSMGRGTDSAGIAYVGQDGLLQLAKTLNHPAAAFPLTLVSDIEAAKEGTVLIGHTRFASSGAVTLDNAHPFLIDGIAFAHNGCISNHNKFGEYAVDSMSLIHGIKKRDFSEYEGSVALVWLENKKLYAYAPSNPLFRGKLGDAIYLASERDFLARIGCEKIKPLAEGKLYSFIGDRIEDTVSVKEPSRAARVVYVSPNFKEYERETYPGYPYDPSYEPSRFLYNRRSTKGKIRPVVKTFPSVASHKVIPTDSPGSALLASPPGDYSAYQKVCWNCGIAETFGNSEYCYPCGAQAGIFRDKT